MMMMMMVMMMMMMMMMIPRFIQHLANGTTLSIVTFGMEARLILPPTVVTDTNRETLYGRVGISMLMSILMSDSDENDSDDDDHDDRCIVMI